MPYTALIIALFGLALTSACLLYLQFASALPPKQVIVGSVAGTIVGVLALSFALLH
jgi:hypothetical protein